MFRWVNKTENGRGVAVEKSSNAPRIIKRECGGWLAVSGRAERVKIGVTAATEIEASDLYLRRIALWREWLGGQMPPGLEADGGLHLA